MKSSRIYLLFVIVSIVTISSLATDDEKPTTHKNDVALENKKKSSTTERPERQRSKSRKYQQEADGLEDPDEYDGFLAGYADNRYTGSHAGEDNYRTRSRWPSQQQQQQQPSQQQFSFRFAEPEGNDWTNEEDWSGIEFPRPNQLNLPSMTSPNPSVSDNGPACYSLVDPQYPIFSDVCGAVPQARYSLPNAFGYHERWQIAQLLTNIVSTSTDSACTRSLRLLLCPVLFPPCQSRQDAPPILPCQSYCRAVKSRCSMPALDALPCESLPLVSDICPTNQAYGSFIPSTAKPAHNQQSPSIAELQSTNYQLSRALASLQSLLTSQGLPSQMNPSILSQQAHQPALKPSLLSQQAHQPALNPSLLSQQAHQSALNPSLLSQQTLQLPLNPSALSHHAPQSSQLKGPQSAFQSHAQQQQQQQLNGRHPYSPDSLSAMFAEFAAQSNGYPYAQNQRYAAALPRPSAEARAQPDARYGNLAYSRMTAASGAVPTGVPSGISSLVKA